MKNNNLLITMAIICIVFASLGWFITGQTTIISEAQQDQRATTPVLANIKTNDSLNDPSDRLTGYKSNHHRSNGQHCDEQAIN
ncbi:hypothetical protein I6N95_23565 [Vagococcus sp. BWB3-3]|uniref:Uncharacterized protein n=1 Tax=Vagococcus allomyrinae TaxID=2794353 RepID=A0A940SU74_9ENTE|nr:hypothetical protein [Vagococcus allomyrinae]MBP1043992.1 hypothetical protein [Vagococcus allomyrinae]